MAVDTLAGRWPLDRLGQSRAGTVVVEVKMRAGWHRGRALLTVVAVGALALGCTSQDAEAPAEAAAPEPAAEELDLAARPDLLPVLPDDRGDPPEELRVEDLVAGDGPPAAAGDTLTVHFVGASWASGQEFDATWDRDQPFTFTLGNEEVIDGWERGLQGVRVGGRRALVIPPDLAYGDRGSAIGIEPGETIVFIVDLLAIDGA